MNPLIDLERYISFYDLSVEWNISELFIDNVVVDLDLSIIIFRDIKYVKRSDVELLRGFFKYRWGFFID
jgi:hypothetical protein